MWGAFAVKAVCEAQGITLSRKIRLIFGCDEEALGVHGTLLRRGGAAATDARVHADAEFPLVHAEKGSFTGTVTRSFGESSADVRLVSFHAGQRPNMVPDEAVAVLTGNPEALGMMQFVLDPMPVSDRTFRRLAHRHREGQGRARVDSRSGRQRRRETRPCFDLEPVGVRRS
jgi:succinyl-diaminopimelate desuccinylase